MMKVYFDGYKCNRVNVYIDTVQNNGHYVLEVRQLNQAIKGLEMLGKKVNKITMESGVYCDMSGSTYSRYPTQIIEKLWNQLGNWICGSTEVKIKGNRLYVDYKGYEIILPKDIRNLTHEGGGVYFELRY